MVRGIMVAMLAEPGRQNVQRDNTLANTIMDEIASKADGSDEMWMSKEDSIFWWNETDDRPSSANLRGIMVAMLGGGGGGLAQMSRGTFAVTS